MTRRQGRAGQGKAARMILTMDQEAKIDGEDDAGRVMVFNARNKRAVK